MSVPILESGDHLSPEEFERRYRNMPEVKKAELIEGVVYMPSPVRVDYHGVPHANFLGWLVFYRAHTPGIKATDNTTIRLDPKNVTQPDALALILPSHGGRAIITLDNYVQGGPEFVGEIASSSVSIDKHTKFRVYQRNGVQEYVIWRVEDKEIDWYTLNNGAYETLPLEGGIYRSRVLPGLWLDPSALVRDDMVRVLEVVKLGIESPEHAEFVRALASKKT